MIKRNSPNTSTSLQTLAEAHLAGGQYLLEEQTLKMENSPIYAGTRRLTGMADFRAKVSLTKNQPIEMVPPLKHGVQL
jgi:hypothetical protein